MTDSNPKPEMTTRRKEGWTAFGMKHQLANCGICPNVKAAVFITYVTLAMAYGCETWNTMIQENSKLSSGSGYCEVS